MKLTLRREVTVERWRVIATLGFAQRRPELVAILTLAHEQPDGVVTGLDVSRDLLAGRPATVGERLLDVCSMMRLVERVQTPRQGWRLTELGHRALENQAVPSPQRGEFDVWLIADALHPEVIVRVRPTEPERQTQPADGVNSGPVEEVPTALLKCQGLFVSPPLRQGDEATEVFVFEVLPHGRCVGQARGEVTVELKSEGGMARFDGEFDGRYVTFAPAAKLPSLPQALAAGATEVEDPLKVAFRTLSDKERRTARREVDVEDWALPGLGEFRARLSDVALVPKTRQDANEWSVWRLIDGVRGYVWPRDFENYVGGVREFAVKEQWAFDVAVPTQVELAQERPDQPALSRSLLVPLDWQSPGAGPSTILILSGRASLAKHGGPLIKKWGAGIARAYVLEAADGKASDDRVTSELGKRAVARRVRQPADVWLRVEAGATRGQRWHPKPVPASKPDKTKSATTEEHGEWKDVPDHEVGRAFEDLRSAFWDRPVQELQPDGGWVSVKPTNR